MPCQKSHCSGRKCFFSFNTYILVFVFCYTSYLLAFTNPRKSVVSIINSVDMNLSKLWEIVEERGTWHGGVHWVTKSWPWLRDWTTKESQYHVFPMWKNSKRKQRHYFADKGPASQSCYFFPVVMYGCKSWTIKKAECQRIDAFELWCWRRLLRVPWNARRSNQCILKEISPE